MSMGMVRRVLVCALALPLMTFDLRDDPRTLAARHCSAHAPENASDYQAVADGRDAQFGIGDVISATRLPDGRQIFLLGDAGYYNINRDGSAGPIRAFGNNSAWVQSGACFTLLD